jgi:phage/plasmid primase-like uncharacterized protein
MREAARDFADAMRDFADAMRAAGLNPPNIIEADGRLRRFASNGKRGDDSGWYVAHDDGIPAGAFGDWRTGVSGTWRADIGRKLSPSEEAAHRAKMDAMRREREAEQFRRHAEAAKKAAEIWSAAQPAPDDHPYLRRKAIKVHGARLHNGALAIPMRDAAGGLCSLQFIDADGGKKFLTGGKVTGCYFGIGAPNGVVCLAEGFATAATIHEATGSAVAVAFNAGNLLAVARALREKFPGLRLIVCADDDAGTPGNPGLAKAREAAQAVGASLAVPGFGADRPEGATDFNDLAAHSGAEAVKRAIEAASAPATESPQANEIDGWPEPLDAAAYHGLAGEIVRTIEPHTEADNAALLVQVLVAFGALVGRGPHVRVEGDQHHGNLFVLLVGETAKARKGTSWGRVREIFSCVGGWPNVASGLSSGEGLKYAVRDPIERAERDKKTGNTEIVQVDPGVADKRLLVIEAEFAQVLRQGARAGNTLSATIRSAWDTGRLATLTKNDPITATGAHICIVGHITADELRAELTATDSANGFANRFLFMAVRRSKVLPFGGGRIPEAVLAGLVGRIARAAAKARTLGAVDMTEAAREAWASVYPTLSEGHRGLFGAVTARAEAQCLRLALMYAMFDEAEAIDRPHLRAAIAVWERAEASARFIFGSALGDPVADEILRALRVAGGEGLTRTGIRDLFRRHQAAERIGAALELLARRNLARRETLATEGRPSEVWRCA